MSEMFYMVRELIQEAKGVDGPSGGYVTDHLDAAEMWLDRIEAAFISTPEVTDHMVDAGLDQYSEGGCMGFSVQERREVVKAILTAAISKAKGINPKVEDKPDIG